MLCDILLCTPTATFSQPEITLGIIPGAGGTQRLTHLIGKARAMDMVLTGRRITGVQAGEWGLASRVIKDGESVVDEAVKVAEQIGGFGRVAVQAGKEAVNGGESVKSNLADYQPQSFLLNKDFVLNGDCSSSSLPRKTKKKVGAVS